MESAGARPQGLEVDVIDPGTSTADATAGSDTTSLSTADETNPQKRPTIHSRAEWGADESIRKGDPDYGEVRGAVVHHTAGVNGYSREEVPAIMRGMLEDVGPRLRTGAVVLSKTVRVTGTGEGVIAAPLEGVAKAHPDMSLGSYPFFSPPDVYGANLVLRGRDAAELDAAERELVAALEEAGANNIERVANPA